LKKHAEPLKTYFSINIFIFSIKVNIVNDNDGKNHLKML